MKNWTPENVDRYARFVARRAVRKAEAHAAALAAGAAPTIAGALADYRRAADALAYVAAFAGLDSPAGSSIAGPAAGGYVEMFGDPDLADAAGLAATVAAAAARLADVLALAAEDDAKAGADSCDDDDHAARNAWNAKAQALVLVSRDADRAASLADAAARTALGVADAVDPGMLAASVTWPAIALELNGDAGENRTGRRFAAQLYYARHSIAASAGMLDASDDDDGGDA